MTAAATAATATAAAAAMAAAMAAMVVAASFARRRRPSRYRRSANCATIERTAAAHRNDQDNERHKDKTTLNERSARQPRDFDCAHDRRLKWQSHRENWPSSA